jgi:hypothetical protein
MRLINLIFRKGEQVVVGVGDGEFCRAVEGLLQTMDDGDFVFNAFEEEADIPNPDIEKQGAAVLTADHGEGVTEALKGLEHKGDVAAADHGPVEVAVRFGRNGHDKVKAEGFIKFDGGSDVSDEEIGGEGFHVGMF